VHIRPKLYVSEYDTPPNIGVAAYFEVVYFVRNNSASTIYVCTYSNIYVVLYSLAIFINEYIFQGPVLYITCILFFLRLFIKKYLFITSSFFFMYCTYVYTVYNRELWFCTMNTVLYFIPIPPL
jgi:hypothetical protein